jgi:hypothetical protein
VVVVVVVVVVDHWGDPGVDGRIILIRMNLQEARCGGMDWIELAQDRECGNEPSGSIKCGEILDYLQTG